MLKDSKMKDDMGVIATDNRKIQLFYNGDTNKGQQTYAYLKSSDKEILNVDLCKTKVTATQWVELADLLNKSVEELINTDHTDFIKEYGENPDLQREDDWLKVLENNPKVVTQPIIVNGDKAIQINTPSEVMSFLEDED